MQCLRMDHGNGPRVDIGEVHVCGVFKLVSQMSIFGKVHAWTFAKSTRRHLFPAGSGVVMWSYGTNHMVNYSKTYSY
jgi:hypothetical protein